MNQPFILTSLEQIKEIVRSSVAEALNIHSMGKENYLNAKEACSLLKVSRAQLTKLMKTDRDFPASCSPDRNLLFKESDLRNYLERIAETRKTPTTNHKRPWTNQTT